VGEWNGIQSSACTTRPTKTRTRARNFLSRREHLSQRLGQSAVRRLTNKRSYFQEIEIDFSAKAGALIYQLDDSATLEPIAALPTRHRLLLPRPHPESRMQSLDTSGSLG